MSPRRPRASTTCASSATRSSSTTRSPRSRRTRPARRGVPADRRRTSAATPTSGPGSCAERGADVPPAPTRPRLRVAIIVLLARLFGTRAVSDLVTALEGDEEEIYQAPVLAGGRGDRRRRARARRDLAPAEGSARRPAPAREIAAPRALAPLRPVRDAAGRDLRGQRRPRARTSPSSWASPGAAPRRRRRARSSSSPASPGSSRARSAWPPASTSRCSRQRELFERQIALERAELEAMPEEEQAEMAALYRAKGFPADEAEGDRRTACSRTRSAPSTR